MYIGLASSSCSIYATTPNNATKVRQKHFEFEAAQPSLRNRTRCRPGLQRARADQRKSL
ncbi:MAG: hypothetical protein VB124_04225 [Burkholderia sp.]